MNGSTSTAVESVSHSDLTPFQGGRSGGVEVAKAEAVSQVLAQLQIAKSFGRVEGECVARIKRACQRRGLAEASQYEYSRGGTAITGASVHLLRAIALAWGNLRYGWTETERRMGESTVKAWAWDQESNTRPEIEFTVRHWRDTKQGGYLLKDERDIYELLANQAARRVRACLEHVIPQDIVEDAVEECNRTLNADAGKESLQDRIRKSVAAFYEIGVSTAQLEAKLQHKIEATTAHELASLGRKYIAIRDGHATVADHFPDAEKVDTAAVVAAASATPRAPRKQKPPEAPPTPASPAPSDPEPDRDSNSEAAPDPTPESASPQSRLADLICSEWGRSFEDLKSTIKRIGWEKAFPTIDTWGSFEEIPADAATRLLNAKRGLELQMKGGAK